MLLVTYTVISTYCCRQICRPVLSPLFREWLWV